MIINYCSTSILFYPKSEYNFSVIYRFSTEKECWRVLSEVFFMALLCRRA